MRATLHTWPISALLSCFLLLPACNKDPEVPQEDEGGLVPVSLSLSLEEGTATKSYSSVVQAAGADDFRGITDITLIPFKTRANVSDSPGAVLSGHERLGFCEGLGDILKADINAGNNGHLFAQKMVPYNTDAFLFYGKAKPLYDDPALEGILVPRGLDGVVEEPASAIVFSPQAIGISASAQTTATLLSNRLTAVATAQDGAGITFKQAFPALYARFTNGENPMSGSSEEIRLLLTDLYTYLQASTGYPSVRAAVQSAIVDDEHISYNSTTKQVVFDASLEAYPGENLPDGSAVIRWDGNQFLTGVETGVLMAPVDRYCYPVGLWYYANTNIRTSEEKDYETLSPVYSGSTTWGGVLGSYGATNGFVRHQTLSIALVEPVRYAVGMLELTLQKSTSNTLLDKEGTKVYVNNTNFPVTGIILGGQRPQLFDFTASSQEDYYVYDTSFDNTSYLSSSLEAVTLRTLALESPRDAVIHFALELLNNSTDSFVGATGLVLPGSKFYLLGELDLDSLRDAQGLINGADEHKVFEKHRKTVVNVTVLSLKDAYNIIPDLRAPQLQVGLNVRFNWTLATPTNVPVY